MDLDIAAVKGSCKTLSKYQPLLYGFETILGPGGVIRVAGRAAKNLVEGIQGIGRNRGGAFLWLCGCLFF